MLRSSSSDISEQKQREQRLTVLNRVLRHNIRNDVTVIRGHLELLSDDRESEHIAIIAAVSRISVVECVVHQIENLLSDETRTTTLRPAGTPPDPSRPVG